MDKEQLDLTIDVETFNSEKETVQFNYKIIVYNDDVNTFEHVIVSLMKTCKHTMEQAEQCAWLIHFKGKCCVKEGDILDLIPIKEAICERGIKAEIEEM